jgi:hypothetical protein
MFVITSQACFFQLLRGINFLPLLVDVAVSGTPPLALSKAVKLKELSFVCGTFNVQRVTMALQTIQSKSLQQITIHPYAIFTNPIREMVLQEWHDLDRLLIQFWTSHAIRLKIAHGTGKREYDLRTFAPDLLPELTRRGLIDLVQHRRRSIMTSLYSEFSGA